MRVDIAARDVCLFIASVLTMQLWINMTKQNAIACLFAAEKMPIYGHAVLRVNVGQIKVKD